MLRLPVTAERGVLQSPTMMAEVFNFGHLCFMRLTARLRHAPPIPELPLHPEQPLFTASNTLSLPEVHFAWDAYVLFPSLTSHCSVTQRFRVSLQQQVDGSCCFVHSDLSPCWRGRSHRVTLTVVNVRAPILLLAFCLPPPCVSVPLLLPSFGLNEFFSHIPFQCMYQPFSVILQWLL